MPEQTHDSTLKSQDAGAPRSASAGQQTQGIEGSLPQGLLQRGFGAPNSLSPKNVQYLQRSIGNRAVDQMLRGDQPNSSDTVIPLQRVAKLDNAAASSDAAAVGTEGGALNAHLEAEIHQTGSGGSPVPDVMRKTMENRMGISYSNVRLHTDAKADRLSRKLNAEAFTLGTNAYFRKGAYNPTTQSGKHLLAHELTHVAQQSGSNLGQVQAKLRVGPVNERYEKEADRVAAQVQSAPAPNSAMVATSAKRLSRKSMTSFSIQRKMSFTVNDLGERRSMNQQVRDFAKKQGIGVEDSSYEKIKTLVRDYEGTISIAVQVAQLNGLLALIQTWVRHHQSRTELDNMRVGILRRLQKAALAEKPKALTQLRYMNDLQASTPDGEAKPGAKKFRFLSETGRAYPSQSASRLAKNEVGNVGQTTITLNLVKQYQLTDAEIAAIKVYAVEDYKYINPAQAGIDPWLKNQMPSVTKIDSERGGSGKVLTSQNNAIRMMIESGTLKKGFSALVLGERDGHKSEPLGRGEVTSVTREKSIASEQAQGEVFRKGELVIIQVTGFADIQKDDIVQFADTSAESMAQATFEGRRHGHMAISGLKKLPDHAGDVFRGFTMLPEVMRETYQVGKEVPYNNFTSTAKTKFPSLKFIEEELVKDKASGGKKVGMLLRLNVQEKGKDISEISQAKHEDEVLMLPGTKFLVQSNPTLTTGEGGYAGLSFYEVRATQVPSNNQTAPTQATAQPGQNQQTAQPAPKRPNAPLPPNPTKAPQGKKKKGLLW